MRNVFFILLIGSFCRAANEPFDWSMDPDDYFDGLSEHAIEHGPPRREGTRANGQVGNFGSGVLIHSIGSGDEAAVAKALTPTPTS